MVSLSGWYRKNSAGKGVGFFQIGGELGDFPVCVVRRWCTDLEWHDVPFWSYFLPDLSSTTSYGSLFQAIFVKKSPGQTRYPHPKFIWKVMQLNDRSIGSLRMGAGMVS